jgi:DNA-binding MarR family transcriptional regulator
LAGWRRPDPKDRRGKLIVLTDPGKRLIDEAIGRHVVNEERLLLSLTQAEQETLDALLKKLIARLRVELNRALKWRPIR